MRVYSIETDYANAQWPSTSIYIAKPVRSDMYAKNFMQFKKKLKNLRH